MQKTKPIRDPVHDYIELTPIEQAIIDRPEFQRLRFVLQNSTAYLTYPGNTHGRFLHSLGVMHIAGEMYCRALQNSRDDTLKTYLTAAKERIQDHQRRIQVSYDDVYGGWDESLGDEARFNHRPLSGKRADISKDDLFLVNTLWQVVRVAGLVHDLGHLPMSHVFEPAVDDILKELDKKTAFKSSYRGWKKSFLDEVKNDVDENIELAVKNFETHEIVGVSVFRTIYPSRHDDERVDAFQKLVFSMVKEVLLYPEPDQSGANNESFPSDNAGILRGLHGIVAGEVDADRLDYCQRDPLVSGLELGAFDLRRIIDSFALHKSEGRYLLLPCTKALSAIESFYHQRYLLYRYLYYHHNVVRMDGILREILVRLLKIIADSTKDSLGLKSKLLDYGLWRNGLAADGYLFIPKDRFNHMDDAWLRTMLAEVFRELLDRESKLESEGRDLLLLLDTFLHRRSENVISMWKKDSDYFQDLDTIFEELKIGGNKRKRIEERLGKPTGWEYNALVPSVKIMLPKNVLLIDRFLKPKTSKELLILVDDRPVDLNKLSPYCNSLGATAESTCLFHFSFVGLDLKSKNRHDDEVTCRKAVMEGLKAYIQKVAELKSTP
jgi:hypothetical protein